MKCPSCKGIFDYLEFSANTTGWEYGSMNMEGEVQDVFESDLTDFVVEEYLCPICSYSSETMETFLSEEEDETIPNTKILTFTKEKRNATSA